MTQSQSPKRPYSLEERTLLFGKEVRVLYAILKQRGLYCDDLRQVVRSSGSVGANYLESQEALSGRDFLACIRISRKEARETVYWFHLLEPIVPPDLHRMWTELLDEAEQITRILTASIKKAEKNEALSKK